MDVRQSSYALLGDCAIHIFSHLQPVLPILLPILIQQLDIGSLPDEEADAAFAVVNNACWSCGEIAMQEKSGLGPYVIDVYERLLAIINNEDIPLSVHENAATALGRLGTYYHEILAPRLPEFARTFLRIMERVEANNEKGQAFTGLNAVIIRNPQAMGDCLLDYFKACATLSDSRSRHEENLRPSFSQVRHILAIIQVRLWLICYRFCKATSQ